MAKLPLPFFSPLPFPSGIESFISAQPSTLLNFPGGFFPFSPTLSFFSDFFLSLPPAFLPLHSNHLVVTFFSNKTVLFACEMMTYPGCLFFLICLPPPSFPPPIGSEATTSCRFFFMTSLTWVPAIPTFF